MSPRPVVLAIVVLLLSVCVACSPLVDCHGDCDMDDGPGCATCMLGCTHAVIVGSAIGPAIIPVRPIPLIHDAEAVPSREPNSIFRPPEAPVPT
ncbi:MAG: hypothetical protein NT029_07875 [Armatimonadetes bacterium]|nr:hypothetical protein [Armatimonadota bacterium]